MRIRLIASDLDGTLLHPETRLTERTIEAVGAARAAGIEVIAATGRGYRTAKELVRPAGIETLVCSNGALVYDAVQERVVASRPLEGDAVRTLVTRLRDRYPDARFGWETPTLMGFEPGFATDGRERPVAEPLETVSEAIKVYCRVPGHDGASLQGVLADFLADDEPRCEVSTSGAPFVEITAPGVDKSTTVARLAAERGLAADQVMAFGDNLNDVALLRWAGIGVAMGDARPEVLAIADRRAGSCEHDGVARVVEALLAEQAR